MSPHILADKPIWSRDGADWPNRQASRFVEAAGMNWHVQICGPQVGPGCHPDGPRPEPGGPAPVILLLHGTGAATHSWAGLLPLLAVDNTVIAPDLPGHGFTTAPDPARLALPDMAAAVGELLAHFGFRPDLLVGHSAGAAIGARMCLDGLIEPRGLISLSGALMPLRGLAGKWFSPAAKLLARTGAAARYVARDARRNPEAVRRLAEGTGSLLNPQQLDWYRLLVTSPGHVAAAVHMMANWNLEPLAVELPGLRPELLLVAFGNDRTVPPAEAERAKARLPRARIRIVGGLGHLAHEEDPHLVAELILEELGRLLQ